MNAPSPSPRRFPWLLGVLLSLAVVLVAVYFARESAEEEAPVAAPPPRVEERASAPASPPVPAAVRASHEEPDAEPARHEEHGPAAVAPGAPELPPTAVTPGADENPELTPEAPQTPEWKLEKTVLIADSLTRRVARLEQEVREAEARGDSEGAAAQRVLLERSRRRGEELQQEMATLREQVRAEPAP